MQDAHCPPPASASSSAYSSSRSNPTDPAHSRGGAGAYKSVSERTWQVARALAPALTRGLDSSLERNARARMTSDAPLPAPSACGLRCKQIVAELEATAVAAPADGTRHTDSRPFLLDPPVNGGGAESCRLCGAPICGWARESVRVRVTRA